MALLEMVEAGTTLDQLNDDEKETRIASRIARTLWRPIPSGSHSLATLQKWYAAFQEHRKRFGGGSGPLPAAIFDKGEALFRQLLQTAETPTLIHGDFHHGNILSSQRDGWLTIDPKGVIGDPIYDLAVFLRNPPPALFSGLITRALLERRIEIFSQELGFDKERIAQWGMAQAVLSAVWSVEESGKGWEQTIAAAELLELLAGNWAWL